jgi:hypothetical protein
MTNQKMLATFEIGKKDWAMFKYITTMKSKSASEVLREAVYSYLEKNKIKGM